jgi:hypothetical protein
LVERAADPTDGRAFLIRATRAADEGFRLARKRLAEIEREWELLIGVQGLSDLATTLEELERWQEGVASAGRRAMPERR